MSAREIDRLVEEALQSLRYGAYEVRRSVVRRHIEKAYARGRASVGERVACPETEQKRRDEGDDENRLERGASHYLYFGDGER